MSGFTFGSVRGIWIRQLYLGLQVGKIGRSAEARSLTWEQQVQIGKELIFYSLLMYRGIV